MIEINNDTLKRFFNCLLRVIDSPDDSTFNTYCEEFEAYPAAATFLKKFRQKIQNELFTQGQIESFIENANNVLLNYAQHKYGSSIELTGNDILDSLITSLDFLGEELNYSTVTTHYLMDIFNSIGDLLLVVDENGNVLFTSETSCKILGYKEEEIKSQNIQMILEENLEFKMIIKNKKIQSNYIFVTKSNHKIPVELKISDFARQDNPFMGHVIIARDISVPLKYQQEIENQNRLIKKTNEELREALKLAEQSEKLKTSFLANMSHEIRTPLNGIMGFSEYIQRPDLSPADYKKFGAIILDCSGQLLSIVNDVLDISRIESGIMSVSSEPVMINKLLDNIYTIYSQKITAENKPIELKLTKIFDDTESYILSDELRLRQILSNLLDNAVKYTEEGKIEFGYKVKNESLEFYIFDTGIGIPEDKHDSIFKPFHQAIESTSKLYSGTGLGLAIAKGLTKLLEGKIYFTSKEGKGSEFFFSLPYMKTISVQLPEPDSSFEIHDGWPAKTIVVVEDDNYSARYLETILKETKANLKFFILGREAIDFIQKEKTDVVLMDIRLPDIDGITATKLIREFDTKIPIIAQTAYASNEDKIKCLRSGCNYHITKPINRNILLSLLDSIIGSKKKVLY